MLYYFLCVCENASDTCDVAFFFFFRMISILTVISYQPYDVCQAGSSSQVLGLYFKYYVL